MPKYYLIIYQSARLKTRNPMLNKVKYNRYLPFLVLVFAINLNEIKLAIEAIRVPRPPILTPINKSLALFENPDKSIAVGTLENAWLATTPTSTSLLTIILLKKALIVSILPRLPINTNKNTNVKSNE